MILTAKQIKDSIGKGIEIKPFDIDQLNPNSYNLKLDKKLLQYSTPILDCKVRNPTYECEIPESGLVLQPNILYLGSTVEWTETTKYIPMIEGRSSLARLGLTVHVSAGFGDVGFKGYWTLEIFCIQPVKIYPNIEICQLYYHTCDQTDLVQYSGKYQNNSGVEASKIYLEDIKIGDNVKCSDGRLGKYNGRSGRLHSIQFDNYDMLYGEHEFTKVSLP